MQKHTNKGNLGKFSPARALTLGLAVLLLGLMVGGQAVQAASQTTSYDNSYYYPAQCSTPFFCTGFDRLDDTFTDDYDVVTGRHSGSINWVHDKNDHLTNGGPGGTDCDYTVSYEYITGYVIYDKQGGIIFQQLPINAYNDASPTFTGSWSNVPGGSIGSIKIFNHGYNTSLVNDGYGGCSNYGNLLYGEFTVTDFNQTPLPIPDFNLTCDTNSQTVQQGQSAAYQIRATSVNGFSGQVTVNVTNGLHSTMTASTSVLNVPSGGSANSPSVSVTTQLTTPAVSYPLTFTGVSGAISKTCQANLIVISAPGPAVDISASPNPVSVNPANNIATTNLSWAISNSDTCEKTSSPANASWGSSATPVSITPANGGPIAVNLTVNTTFTITCHRSGNNVSDSELVVVNPNPAFTVVPASLSFTGTQGGALPAAQNFTITNTGNQSLTFSISNNRSWLNLGWSSVTVPIGGNTVVSMQPNTTASLVPSPDTSTVTFNSNSTAGSVTRPVTYTLNPAPSFSVNCASINPNTSQTVTRGATASWSVPVIGRDGFNQTVTLAITAGYPTNSTPVNGSAAFTGSPNPENRSGSVSLITGATTDTGTFNNIIVTATAPGYTSQQCTLAPLVVNAFSFNVTPPSLSFSAQQGASNPAPQSFSINNNSTTSLTFSVTKTAAQTWYTISPTSGIIIPPGGSATVSVQPNTTAAAGNFADPNVVFDSASSAGTQTKSVNYTVSSPPPPSVPTVTAQCASNSNAFTNGTYSQSASPGAGVTCNLSSSGAGYIRWTSTNSADGRCSVLPNTGGDSIPFPVSAANPTTPAISSVLNNPPAQHSFTVQCTSPSIGVSPGSDNVTFNVPAGGTYNLGQSAKHAVAVNQPTLSASALDNSPYNTNPCNGLGGVNNALTNNNFKEGDTVTFAINICNTGTGELNFNGSGDNTNAIILTDVLGNLAKPTSGWNAQVSCGTDCQLAAPDDTTQPGKILFYIQAKPGSTTNRIVSSGGLWTLYFNAIIRAPSGGTQSFYYFTNCVADTTTPAMRINNSGPGTWPDIYHNIIGSTFDLPGLCMKALFSRGASVPDRHEIAP